MIGVVYWRNTNYISFTDFAEGIGGRFIKSILPLHNAVFVAEGADGEGRTGVWLRRAGVTYAPVQLGSVSRFGNVPKGFV